MGQRSHLTELSLRQRCFSRRIIRVALVGSATRTVRSFASFSGCPEMLPVLCLEPLAGCLLRGALPKQLLRARSGGGLRIAAWFIRMVHKKLRPLTNTDRVWLRSTRRVPEPTGSYVPANERSEFTRAKARDLYCAAERVLLECSSRALLNTVATRGTTRGKTESPVYGSFPSP